MILNDNSCKAMTTVFSSVMATMCGNGDAATSANVLALAVYELVFSLLTGICHWLLVFPIVALYDLIYFVMKVICQWLLIIPASLYLLSTTVYGFLCNILVSGSSRTLSFLHAIKTVCVSALIWLGDAALGFMGCLYTGLVSYGTSVSTALSHYKMSAYDIIQKICNSILDWVWGAANGLSAWVYSGILGFASWVYTGTVFFWSATCTFISWLHHAAYLLLSTTAGYCGWAIGCVAKAIFDATYWTLSSTASLTKSALYSLVSCGLSLFSAVFSLVSWMLHTVLDILKDYTKAVSQIMKHGGQLLFRALSAVVTFLSSKPVTTITVFVFWVLVFLGVLYTVKHVCSSREREERELQENFRWGVMVNMKMSRELRGLDDGRNPIAEAVNTVWDNQSADVSDPNVREMATWFGDLRKFGYGEDSYCLRPRRVSTSNGTSPASSLSGF